MKGDLPSRMSVSAAQQSLRIAIVYGRMPLPMTRADQMTVAHLISYFSARGHAVDLFTLDTGESLTQGQRNWLESNCRRIDVAPQGILRSLAGSALALLQGKPLQIGWFTNRRQRERVREAIRTEKYDVVYTYYVRSAEAVRGIAPAHGDSQPVTYLALQLSQALNAKRIFERATRLKDRLIYSIERVLLRDYEARIWRDFSRTVLIGQQDVDEIRAASRERGLPEIDNYLLCAHGVDIERFAPRQGRAEPATLVFSGVMGTNTNVEAITWFVQNCWSTVKAAVPDAKLIIVGRSPAPEVTALGSRDSAITVTGEVRDPAEYIARATVCINPMQAGAGMQNKLIEYLASGKAVVATTIANEGVRAIPDIHLVEADSPEAFSRATIDLLLDPARRDALGRAARVFVEREWTWEKFFVELETDMVHQLRQPTAAPVRPAKIGA